MFEVSFAGMVIILLAVFYFRKSIKLMAKSSERSVKELDPILVVTAQTAAKSAVAAATLHSIELQKELENAGVTESLESLVDKYRSL